MDNIKIYDFCGTLVKPSNTTKEFIKFTYERKHISKIKYYAPWILASILVKSRLIKPYHYMKLRVYSLKGIDLDTYNNIIKNFVQDVLIKQKNENLIVDILNNKEEVIIISYGLKDIIIEFIKQSNVLNSKIYASTLSFVNKKLSGKYHHSIILEGKKNTLLNDYDNNIIENAVFYTDDFKADNDLVEFIEKSVLV